MIDTRVLLQTALAAANCHHDWSKRGYAQEALITCERCGIHAYVVESDTGNKIAA